MKSDYYVEIEGRATGPYSLNQLRGMWANGAITARTNIGLPDAVWFPAEKISAELDANGSKSTLSLVMGIVVYLIIALIGIGVGAHGVEIESAAQSAVHQTIAAIYIVGGCLIVAISVIAFPFLFKK